LPDQPTTEISELLAGYALGALDPDERDFIARNLPRHPAWQAELDGYLAVSTALAHLPEPQDVPLRARAAVLAAVDALESDVPLESYRKAAWNATLPARALLEQAQPPDEGRNWRKAVPKVALYISMPATLVAIVFAMYTVVIHNQYADRESEMAEFQQESAEVFTSDSSDRQVIDLVASRDAPFARGSLFIDRAQNAAVLVARDLPPISDDERYVVWAQTSAGGQEFAHVGTLTPNDAGTAQLIVDPPDLFARYVNLLVTLEPVGDDITRPSGSAILSGGI
jgi:hypothetical protein